MDVFAFGFDPAQQRGVPKLLSGGGKAGHDEFFCRGDRTDQLFRYDAFVTPTNPRLKTPRRPFHLQTIFTTKTMPNAFRRASRDEERRSLP